MCAACRHVFASEAGAQDAVDCPECGFSGPPAALMRPSPPPSLEVLCRSWRRAVERARTEEK